MIWGWHKKLVNNTAFWHFVLRHSGSQSLASTGLYTVRDASHRDCVKQQHLWHFDTHSVAPKSAFLTSVLVTDAAAYLQRPGPKLPKFACTSFTRPLPSQGLLSWGSDIFRLRRFQLDCSYLLLTTLVWSGPNSCGQTRSTIEHVNELQSACRKISQAAFALSTSEGLRFISKALAMPNSMSV